MNQSNAENLRALFERFVDQNGADQAAKDIEAAEQMLRQYPVPQPSLELLLRIKADMAIRLERKSRAATRRRVFEVLAIAAAVVILACVGLKMLGGNGAKPQQYMAFIPRAIWETYDIASEDPALAFFTTEVQQIESDLRNVESPSKASGSDDPVSEIEVELQEIATDFWKG